MLFFLRIRLRIDWYQSANSSAWRGVFILYYARVAQAHPTLLASSLTLPHNLVVKW